MWCSVEALFVCDVPDEPPEEVLYERRIFLIKTEDEQHVQDKAQQVALSFEVSYKNYEDNDVQWKFVKILEIQELYEEELYDGVEVFSRLQFGAESLDD
jgi:hypothetical protein